MISKIIKRVENAEPGQKEALIMYIVACGIFAIGDIRFKGKHFKFSSEIQNTYLALYVAYAMVRWLRKLTPIGKDDDEEFP